MNWTKSISIAALVVVLSGCSSVGRQPLRAQTAVGNQPLRPQPTLGTPTALPQRNITSFSDGLRCMDDLLLRHGTRDVSIMLEEMQDKTGRLGAGTRDMMISAVSDMTRRSRAIKLMAFGVDNLNIVNFLQTLQRQNQFSLVPQFDIRGAITQFDNEVQRKQSGLSVSLLNLLGVRFGKQTTVSVLGFDASVIQTADLTLIPGLHSKNTLAIARSDGGPNEATASLEKIGINYSMNFTRQDGQAQALRNMVELATIELIGKLARVPYWTCVGIDPSHPEVLRETEDWFLAMRGPSELNGFMQEHLRNRKFYDGPVDGKTNPALRQAITAYQRSVGRPATGRVDLAFFRDFVNKPVPQAPEEPFSVVENTDLPLGEVKLTATSLQVNAGEPIQLSVTSSQDAYLYCYSRNDNGRIQRIFPNRFVRDPRVSAGQTVSLPGKSGFVLRANRKGDQHQFACVAAGRELYNDLAPPLRWSDFEDIGLKSFEAIREGFANASDAPVTMTELSISLVGGVVPAAPAAATVEPSAATPTAASADAKARVAVAEGAVVKRTD